MTDHPYTEADVRRAAQMLADNYYGGPGDLHDLDADDVAEIVQIVLTSMAAAGRLLPEGWTVARVDEQFRKLAADVNEANRPPTGGYTGLTGQIIVTVDHGSADE